MGTATGIFGLVSLTFVVVGAVLVVVGVRIGRAAREFDRRAVRVPAKVIEVKLRRTASAGTDPGSGVWVPVLEFTTVDGRPVRTESMFGSVPAPARAGDRVAVLYDPEQPTRARVADRVLANGGCLSGALLAVGVLIGMIGLVMGAAAAILPRFS